jgi:translocator protein
VRNWIALGVWLLVTALAAAVGGVGSSAAPEVYAALQTPSWSPPSWVFGPVWTTLYLFMAIAAWLVWKEAGWSRGGTALWLYLAQLGLNALWSWLFFAWQLRGLATLEIGLLLAVLILTLLAFWRIRRLAGMLLLPYLAWVVFASVLCFRIWQLNRG